MENYIQSIVRLMLPGVSTNTTWGPIVARLAEARASMVSQAGKKWQIYPVPLVVCKTTGPQRPKEQTDAVIGRSARRAAQAWICISSAVYLDDGEPDEVILEDTFALFICLDLVDLLLKFVKEQSVYTAAVGLGQEDTNERDASSLIEKISKLGIPTASEGRTLHPGDLGFVGQRINATLKNIRKLSNYPGLLGAESFMIRQLRRCQNILYVKRGLPSTEPWEVAGAVERHKIALSSPHQKGDERILIEVQRALEDLCYSVFNGALFEPDLRFPSMNASFASGKQSGGALGEVWEASGPAKFASSIPDSAFLSIPVLDRMVEISERTAALSGLPRVVEVHRLGSIQEHLTHFERTLAARVVDSCLASFPDGKMMANVPTIKTLPAAVCEPAKVRMITMGEATPYTAALSIQKFLHGTMKRTQTFQWIGKPIEPTDWSAVFDPERITGLLRSDPSVRLVSGDYTAATDNLDPEMSEAAWRAIAASVLVRQEKKYVPLVRTPWYQLGQGCLTNHLLYHGHSRGELQFIKESEKENMGVRQAWGQLMGSPMSFPILNLVNAAATAVGLGWVYDPMKPRSVCDFLKSHCVATNGDDIVFWATTDQIRNWSKVVSAVGLTPSLGKNYTSRNFLIMNSEMRVLVRTQGPTRSGEPLVDWQFQGFLNLPILYGMEAKGSRAGSVRFDTLAYFEVGPLSRALVRETIPTTAARRLERFVEYHREVLQRAPAGCVWECPQALGGLGLPRFSSSEIPEKARVRMAWLACLDTERRLREVTPPTRKAANEWDRAVRDAMHSGKSYQVVSSRSFLDDDYLPPRLLASNIDTGGKGAVLGQLLSNLSGYDEDQDYDFDGPVKKESEAAPAERSRRETAFTHKIMRQNRLSQKSGLEAMLTDTMCSWSDHRILEVIRIDPNYDIRVRL